MISYDELVVALQAWRAKQGLPISQMSAMNAQVAPAAAAPRTVPPSAPPRAASPEPLATDEALDVDDAAMLEETAYENEGNDFAMSFNPGGDEATSIGSAPVPEYGATNPTGKRGGGGNRNDW